MAVPLKLHLTGKIDPMEENRDPAFRVEVCGLHHVSPEEERRPAGQVYREKARATNEEDERDAVLNTCLSPPIPPTRPPPSLFTHQTPAVL